MTASNGAMPAFSPPSGNSMGRGCQRQSRIVSMALSELKQWLDCFTSPPTQ